jgi:hypothetical protein
VIHIYIPETISCISRPRLHQSILYAYSWCVYAVVSVYMQYMVYNCVYYCDTCYSIIIVQYNYVYYCMCIYMLHTIYDTYL